MNKIYGKVHWLTLLVLAFAAIAVAFFFFSPEHPQAAGVKFMDALARHDVKVLTDKSYIEDMSKEEVSKQWDYAVNNVGKHFIFHWTVTGCTIINDKRATVKFDFVRNANSTTAFAEKYELPMVKKEGKWQVDLRGVDRRMFPSLPR